MALFSGNKETKEEKAERKQQEILEKYGMQDLSDQCDIDSVRRIAIELAGEGWMDFGMMLGGASEKDMLKRQLYNQRTIIEQNFIMIRQLDRISKLLSK